MPEDNTEPGTHGLPHEAGMPVRETRFWKEEKSSKQTGYTLPKITQSSWRRKSPNSQRRKAMRRNSIITLLAVVVIGAGLKVALLSTPPAQAVPAFKSKGLDIQQMQQNITNLPVQKIHDMTFVFSAD